MTPRVVLALASAVTLLLAPCSRASANAVGAASWAAAALAGQNAARPADQKREVASLLSRARTAMAEADWDTAETFVSRAESLHVQFGKLYMGDTPAKVRRELDRLRPVKDPFNRPTSAASPRPNPTSQIPLRARGARSRSRRSLGASAEHATGCGPRRAHRRRRSADFARTRTHNGARRRALPPRRPADREWAV